MRVSRWLLGLILLLAVIVPAQAQQAPPATTKTLTAAGASNCTASAAGCLLVGAAGFGGLGVDLSGTFVGTVSFEGIVSTDTTGTFTAVYCTPWNSATPVASTTAVGQWGCPVGGLSYFRVRLSAYTSGSVVVVTRGAPTLARASGGGGGTITGSLAPEQVAFGTAVNTIGGSANLTWINGNELIVADTGEVSLASSGIVLSGIADENTIANFYYYNEVYDGYAGFKMTDTGNTVWDLGNVSALLTVQGFLTASSTVDGDGLGFEVVNLSNTADSSVYAIINTTGDNATGQAMLELGVHYGGADESAFSIVVAGDSGNNTPNTTMTAPGMLQFAVPGDAYRIEFLETGTAGELSLRSWNNTDNANMGYAYTEWTMATFNVDGGAGVQVFGFGYEANISDTDVVTNQNFYIYDHVNAAYLMSMTPTTLAFDALTTTGAATGKKVVCVDTATGILYASSTGTDCSN